MLWGMGHKSMLKELLSLERQTNEIVSWHVLFFLFLSSDLNLLFYPPFRFESFSGTALNIVVLLAFFLLSPRQTSILFIVMVLCSVLAQIGHVLHPYLQISVRAWCPHLSVIYMYYNCNMSCKELRRKMHIFFFTLTIHLCVQTSKLALTFFCLCLIPLPHPTLNLVAVSVESDFIKCSLNPLWSLILPWWIDHHHLFFSLPCFNLST